MTFDWLVGSAASKSWAADMELCVAHFTTTSHTVPAFRQKVRGQIARTIKLSFYFGDEIDRCECVGFLESESISLVVSVKACSKSTVPRKTASLLLSPIASNTPVSATTVSRVSKDL